ncbi:hypothetical protein A28LD_2264 [Idiomarina sp. A28L]|uniref:hypothetical protein n=1 Tax=Idiomarina sp. A28L TaxID=1036674 RepID=UPI0002138D8A|nr:hypothetical protein [Idiomarina sp. A28L]EGN74237.1 hypothetical protein A28LD_2264 [Idiomarina sp. A28L]
MVDFISPLAMRVRRQRKRYRIELCCALTVVIGFVAWQYSALPVKLSSGQQQQLRAGYQLPPTLAPHPLYRQLQLLNALGIQLNEGAGLEDEPLHEHPQIHLHRVQFLQETASLTLFIKSAQNVQKLTNGKIPDWEITHADLQELTSSPPYEWELSINLKPINSSEQHYD